MQKTVLYDHYAPLGAKTVDFNGWLLPVQFSGIIEEHNHTRSKAGVFDCSHMGEFLLEGTAALEAFDRLVFSEILGLKVGPCRYSCFLNKNGGIVDDCVVFKLDEASLYVVTNAGPLDRIAALLDDEVPGCRNVSDETTKIDVQGPASRQVLLDIGMEGIAPMKYWRGGKATWRGTELLVTRAGYTGELGYELFMPNAIGVDLFQAALDHEATLPCGLGARDTLRLETSRPLSGEDLTEDTTPLQAGMDPLVVWTKDFVGKAALEAQREEGGYPLLTPLRSLNRRAPRHGQELKCQSVPVGEVTSGAFGPSLGCGVGLGYLPPDLAESGIELTAGPKDLPLETESAPIYTEGTARMKFDDA